MQCDDDYNNAKQYRLQDKLLNGSDGWHDHPHPHVTFRPPLSPLIVLRHILTNETISQELGPTPVINPPSLLVKSELAISLSASLLGQELEECNNICPLKMLCSEPRIN